MNPLLADYARVTKRRPCPICGKPDWCLLARDGTSAICGRIISSEMRGDAGYLHKIKDNPDPIQVQPRVFRPPPPVAAIDFEALCANMMGSITAGEVSKLADQLGVTTTSLRWLGIGRDRRHAAYSFPMRNADREVIGIQLRPEQGKKFAVTGSNMGLFIPSQLDGSGPLFIVEGASDTAALLDMGFDAIGRPSCSSCVDMTTEFVAKAPSREWVIIEDHDEPKTAPNGRIFYPGQEGATKLAESLVRVKPGKVIAPIGAKDTREWKQRGATRNTIISAVKNASYFKKPPPVAAA